MLERGFTRETGIRRDARGRWFDGDDPIEHPHLVESFDGWIDRAPDGRFCLSNDINWAFVAIEGPPYFVRSVRFEGEAGSQTVTLRLSGGREETLDPTTLRLAEQDDALWCDVRGGAVPARFDDHAVQRLADVLDEDAEGPYFSLAGARIRPRRVADPLAGWDASRGHVETRT